MVTVGCESASDASLGLVILLGGTTPAFASLGNSRLRCGSLNGQLNPCWSHTSTFVFARVASHSDRSSAAVLELSCLMVRAPTTAERTLERLWTQATSSFKIENSLLSAHN